MERSTRIALGDLVRVWSLLLFMGTVYALGSGLASLVRPWTIGVGVVAAVVVALGSYLVEHERLPTPNELPRRSQIRLLAVAVVALAALLVAVRQRPTATTDAIYAGVFGVGIGRTAYRLYYGIVRPVPVSAAGPKSSHSSRR